MSSALAVAIALASGGCVGELSGELRSQGVTFGDRSWRPTRCASGATGGFFGADLVLAASDGSGEKGMRAIKDAAAGDRVQLYAPQDGFRYAELTRASCAVLRNEVELGGWHAEGVTAVNGRVAIDCRLPDQGRLAGEIRFQGCTR